jgi:hypothetical protein
MKRLRITISCLMMIVAVIALDFAVLQLMGQPAGDRVFFGAMPMADVLAVLLAITVGRLQRRGEASLSHVMFLLVGGMALISLGYLVHLRPDLAYEYLRVTVGRWGVENRLVDVLLLWLAVSVPILVPALFVGLITRGYRLKLTTSVGGHSAVASHD